MNRRLLTGTVAFACLCLIASESYAWNQPPVAVIKVNGSGLYHNHVVAGEEVEFDGSDSYDYGGEIVQYTWYIFSGGDAEHSSLNEPVMRATFRTGGNVKIRLRVKDNEGAYSYDYCRVYITDLDVDSNRNININYDDEENEDTWQKGAGNRGAIVLPNCDDDDGDGIPDNWPGEHNIHDTHYFLPGDWNLDGYYTDDYPLDERPDNNVNGNEDIADLAELWVHQFRHGRFGATFTLEVENPEFYNQDSFFEGVAAQDMIRIFEPTKVDGEDLVVDVGDEEVIGPASGDTHSFYCGFSGTIKFGVEGIEPGAIVDIKLTVSQEDYDDCIDTIRMRVAPFVLADNSMDIDVSSPSDRKTIYVSDSSYYDKSNLDLRTKLYNVYTNHLDQTTDGYWWPWHQDGYDVGYVKAPYGDMQVIIVTPRAYISLGYNLFAQFAHNDLLEQPNVGVWWGIEDGDTELTYNSTGNIECRPGDSEPGDFFFGQEEDIEDNIKDFFAAQNVNSSLSVDTDWLFVGHVDEIASFAPDGQHTIIPDPNVCWALLMWAEAADPSNAKILNKWVTSSILKNTTLRNYNLEYHVMAGDNLPSIRTDLGLCSPVTITEWDSENGQLVSAGAFIGFFDNDNTIEYKITFTNATTYFLEYREEGSQDYILETNAYGLHTSDGVKHNECIDIYHDCIFQDAKCFILKHDWEGSFQENESFEFEADPTCKTIEMPVLFEERSWGGHYGAAAMTIDHANCLVDGDRVFTGQTHEVNTGNVIKDYVEALFGKAGYYYNPQNPESDNIIDADTINYHTEVGDVHYATNALRVIPDSYKWWE